MSRIQGKNTKIDLKMKEMLEENKILFEMYPKIPGTPDFIIRQKKIAIFCDGDFWHGFKFDESKKPAKKYWHNKIEENMRRDRKVSRKLRRGGWSVLRFWEHDIEKKPKKCKDRILRKIRKINEI